MATKGKYKRMKPTIPCLLFSTDLCSWTKIKQKWQSAVYKFVYTSYDFFPWSPFDGQLRPCSGSFTFHSFQNGWPCPSFHQIAQRTNTKEADRLRKNKAHIFIKSLCFFLTLKHPQIFHLQMLLASSQCIPNVEEEK